MHEITAFRFVAVRLESILFNIRLISASLNKNKEVLGENNDVEPTVSRMVLIQVCP